MTKIWPQHPKPKQDELFSSWLFRLSRANGQKTTSICSLITKNRNILNNNLDNNVSEEFIEDISVRCGIDKQLIDKTIIRNLNGKLFLSDNNYFSFILKSGDSKNVHNSYALQACPICLKEDGFYRISWKMSFITVCVVHGCILIDRCEKCGFPINPIRNDIGDQKIRFKGDFSKCYNCDFNLIDSKFKLADENVVKETKFYMKILEKGGGNFNEHYFYSFHFFYVLKNICIQYFLNVNKIEKNIIEVDCMPLSERYECILEINGIFDSWPEKFIDYCEKYKIFYSSFDNMNKNKLHIPYWFEEVLKTNLYFPNLSPSKESIENVILYMNYHGIKINPYSVNRFMGFRDSSVINKTVINYIKKRKV